MVLHFALDVFIGVYLGRAGLSPVFMLSLTPASDLMHEIDISFFHLRVKKAHFPKY